MNDNKLDLLLKTDDNSTVSLNTSEQYTNTKRRINSICKALCLETKDYLPQLFKIRYLNKFCLFTAILILIAWILHIPSFADFISRFLPWCILSSSFFF